MKMLLFFLAILVLLFTTALGQTAVIENFDTATPATDFHTNLESPSTITLTNITADKVEGTGSMMVQTKLANVHSWGTYSEFGHESDVATPWNWSSNDSLSIWIKVSEAPGVPANVVMRMHITDQPTASDNKEDWIYENTTILDATSGWVNLRFPLFAREVNNSNPDGTGFIPAPTGWNLPRNNEKFDMDHIVAWRIAIVTANTAPDSVDVLFDNLERVGTRAFPVTIFNGIDFTGVVTGASPWVWGGSSVSVEQNAGPLPKTNAIIWTQGAGWTGWGADLNPTNMAGSWGKDSIKLKIKCESGVGALRVQLEDGVGKKGKVFTPTADNQWHDYAIALKDLVFQDNTTHLDSSAITKFGLMAENSGITGKVLYVTNIWTGSPSFDVIPPDAPSGVSAITTDPFNNLILWTDITGEPNPRYNVYYSEKAWTSVDDPSVTDIPPSNQPQGTQLQTHLLRTPLTDKQVTYYYGVAAKDEAGNLSAPALSGAVTNTAKGIPTISMSPPAFVADGDLSEWSSITPFVLSINGGAHKNEVGVIDGDADVSAKAYLAVDDNYLYVAYDVTDENVVVDTTLGNTYENDSPDLFIGLYQWIGKTHAGIKSGATPDYHLRFAKNRALIDNNGKTIMYPGVNYAWQQKLIDPGYTVEAKMSFTDLATLLGGGAIVLAPQNGYRIPIDIVINDRDNKAASDFRDGLLIYSAMNTNDYSWQDMWRWTYTWLGTGVLDVNDQAGVVNTFRLDQNYPNPFNPATQIRFSLEKAGYTTLKVYDVLGRLIATLAEGYQEAGPHTFTFDAGRNISSGLYLYRVESGSFSAVKKMVLIK